MLSDDPMRRWGLGFLVTLGLYLSGYAFARLTLFHAVETYLNEKAGPRQDRIVPKGDPTAITWQYLIFLPAIKSEEAITNSLYTFRYLRMHQGQSNDSPAETPSGIP